MTTRGRDTAQLVTSRLEVRPASWLEAGWPRDLRRPLWLVPATVPRPDAGGGGQVAPVWTDRRGSGDARSDASTGTPALQACSAGRLVLRGHSATPARWPTALSTATCLHTPPTPRGAAPQRPDAWFTTLPTRRSGPAPRLRWSPARPVGCACHTCPGPGHCSLCSWRSPPPAYPPHCRGQMVVLLKPRADHARPLFKAPSLTRKKQSPSSCRVLQGPAGLTRPELPGHLLPTRWPCGPLCGPHLPHTTLRKRKTIFGL